MKKLDVSKYLACHHYDGIDKYSLYTVDGKKKSEERESHCVPMIFIDSNKLMLEDYRIVDLETGKDVIDTPSFLSKLHSDTLPKQTFRYYHLIGNKSHSIYSDPFTEKIKTFITLDEDTGLRLHTIENPSVSIQLNIRRDILDFFTMGENIIITHTSDNIHVYQIVDNKANLLKSINVKDIIYVFPMPKDNNKIGYIAGENLVVVDIYTDEHTTKIGHVSDFHRGVISNNIPLKNLIILLLNNYIILYDLEGIIVFFKDNLEQNDTLHKLIYPKTILFIFALHDNNILVCLGSQSLIIDLDQVKIIKVISLKITALYSLDYLGINHIAKVTDNESTYYAKLIHISIKERINIPICSEALIPLRTVEKERIPVRELVKQLLLKYVSKNMATVTSNFIC